MDESSAAVLLGVKQELSITPATVSRYHTRPNQVGKPASGGYLKVGEPLYRLSSGELVVQLIRSVAKCCLVRYRVTIAASR